MLQGNTREIMLRNIHLKDINPLICGYEKCLPRHEFGPFTREYYLLHYVFSGKGILKNDRGVHIVQPGELFVIRPKEKTIYTADEHKPWEYYWVGFESSLDLSERLSKDVIMAPDCCEIFKSMFEYNNSDDIEFFICSKVFEILTVISNTSVKNKTDSYILAAKNYIETNYNYNLSVGAISDSLGLNRSYFWKSFKQNTGKSPQQYIIDFRLEKAKVFMKEYSMSPGEAALEIGYPDVFSFSRMFKRKYGISPSIYIEGIK